MHSSLFLAKKYLRPRRSFISLVPIIAVYGVAVGVMVMIVVLGVMSGFSDMWKHKLTEFKPHITMQPRPGLHLYEDDLETIGKITGIEGVKGVVPSVVSMVVVEHYNEEPIAPFIRGTDFNTEAEVTGLNKYLEQGRFETGDNEVVIGKDLAAMLGTWVGETISVQSPNGIGRLPTELLVVGTFNVGMFEIDGKWMLTNLDTARDLANVEEGVQQYEVRLDDAYDATVIRQQLDRELGLQFKVRDWLEENAGIVRALNTEKVMMFFVMIIVSIVAAFGIVNTLITMSYQKTHDIGLMNAMGFSRGKILGVFTWVGVLLGFLGVFLGVTSGLFVLHFRNEILGILGINIFPKDMYEFDQIPAAIKLIEVAFIAGISLFFSVFAAYITALRAVYMNPVEALRNE